MKKFLAMTLALLLILTIVPMSTLAAGVDSQGITNLTDIGFTIVTNDESTLAPGITLNEMVIFDKDGKRVEMYVTTSDSTLDTVHFYANYKDNDITNWGMQTLSEQVAAIEANYEEPFKVVAGLNASYYNVTTGAPTGAFVMEGVDMSSGGDNYAFFAVLKDGTVMIGNKGDYSSYKGQIKEAIGGYVHIVKDGAVVAGLDKVTKYPRQTIGLTADGKVITMTADGSQTQTVGLTYQEQAEVMLALGCVDALHLDGGNSATFGTIPEGSDKFVTTNSPSGGAERAVSNTLMIVSTAVADGTFDHAVISGEYEYQLPYTTTKFSAIGVDASNSPADSMPETLTWTLSDDSFGTIKDGVFVSTGKVGDVDIQMSNEGKVVGSKTIHVVNPTAISFANAETTIPYGKFAPLKVIAMYGNNEAFCAPENFAWSSNPAAAGTFNGFDFTACDNESITSAVITATYKYANITPANITVKFGKGSEVLFDFEDGDISDWRGTDTINEWIDALNAANPDKNAIYKPESYSNNIYTQSSSVFLASEENGGRVKNGNYSLGFRLNHLNLKNVNSWVYNYLYYTGDTKIFRDVAAGKTAIRLGMWVYSPDVTNVAFRLGRARTEANGTTKWGFSYMISDYDGVKTSYATNYAIPEAGWIYIYYDITDYADNLVQSTSLYNPDTHNGVAANVDTYPAFLQLFSGSATDTMDDIVYYIDDITLDYSDVTDDRDAPTISNITVSSDTANFVALNGQTVDNNLLSFAANVTDVSGNANATGLNYATAKIYIDGVDVSSDAGFKAANGIISLNDVYLTNGTHSIAFVIFDNQGNETRVTKTITVNASATNAKVYIKGHNDGNNVPKAGSVYYVDVMASDAAQIGSVTTTLKLNTANKFEYDNIICAKGVTVTTNYDELDFELTLNITHDGTSKGETTLVSVPVRVWSWDEEATGIAAADQFKTGAIPTMNVKCKTVYGKVEYVGDDFDSYYAGFYGDLNVVTELDNKTAWHVHTPNAVADKAATCVECGYQNRTYCADCASVIDWGITLDIIPHSYSVADGVLKCECGLLFTGIYTDGKTYVDGVVITTGWQGDYYYLDGVKLTGVQKVMAPDASGEFYYDFGEDGVSKGKFTGVFFDSKDDVYRYSKIGVLAGGWNMVGSDWYYFDTTTLAAATGSNKLGAITYEFEENGKLVSGVWAPTLFGTRYYYGPGYHKSGWFNIDGKDYCFDNGYRLENGWQLILESQQYRNWYFFTEDGVCEDKTLKPSDGIYTDRNGVAGAVNGIGLSGLREINGKYYYFNHHGYAQNNGTYSGRLFLEDYAAYTGLYEKDGVLYYYQDGRTATCGLFNIDGDYYYSYWGGVIKTSGKYFVSQTYCDLPAGNYEFGADGKMLDGLVEKDGVKYLYANGKLASYGLYKIGDDYYFASSEGNFKTNGRYWVSTTYCDLPAGNYTFGADGKMLNGVVNVDGALYLYINGTTATHGLVEIDGKYYFPTWGGVLKTDGRYYVSRTYCDLPVGNYTFGEDGAMLDGVVNVDGTYYLYNKGTTETCGLFEIDGKYYYSYWGGVLKTDGRYYVSRTYCDLPVGNYTFGADGAMLDGVVNVDGTYYLYNKGTTETCGLFEIDGKYYYSYWGGVLKTDGRYYVSRTYCDLPAGNYTFGADGAMLDGIVNVDGTYYLYENGNTVTAGLYKVDGDYYYADWGGVLKTDGRYYAARIYCDLPAGNYTFGTDGKMLNGFVTIDGTKYYYKNGSCPAPGIIEVDGDFYFVTWNGVVVTNKDFYVTNGNGYTISMTYTFDAEGRIIG